MNTNTKHSDTTFICFTYKEASIWWLISFTFMDIDELQYYTDITNTLYVTTDQNNYCNRKFH